MLADPTGTVVGVFGADQSFFCWSLEHWARVVSDGSPAFLTHDIYAPQGFNLAWTTSIPGPALLLVPVTLTLGPVVSYNVLALLAPALSALAAWALCRRLSGSSWAALAGGYLYGFGSYALAEQLNHVDLELVPLIPVAALVVIRRVDGELGRTLFVALLAAATAGQFLIFPELVATGTLLGAITFALALMLADPPLRSDLLGVVPEIALALGLAALAVSPQLIAMTRHGNPIAHGLSPGAYSTDVTNVLTPTQVTALGSHRFAARAARISGNVTEQLAYLGPVLPLCLIAAVVSLRRRALAWGAALTGLAALVLSLGPHLLVSSHRYGTLPWAYLMRLPLLGFVLPARMQVFVWLAAAVLISLWLGSAGRLRALRIAAVLAAGAFLFPSLDPYGGPDRAPWSTSMRAPPFFSGGRSAAVLRRDENVLVLPFGYAGGSMYWQAKTGMSFRLVGGYAAAVLPPSLSRYPIVGTFYGDPLPLHPRSALRALLAGQHVDAVLVQQGTGDRWPTLLAGLGLRPRALGGMLVYRLRPAAREAE